MPSPFRPLGLALLLTACADSGLGVPATLATAHVEVVTVQPELARFAAEAKLGMVRGLVQAAGDTAVLAIGSDGLCRVTATDAATDCVPSPFPIESVYPQFDANGQVTALVVSGAFGKPSAARLTPRGEVTWRFDGEVRNMGSIAVADLPDGRAVIVSGTDSSAVLDPLTGAVRGRRRGGRVMLGADWMGAGDYEHLYAGTDSTFAMIGASGRTIAALTLPSGSWPEPVMTPVTGSGGHPYLVSAAGPTISVFDAQLNPVRTLSAPDLVAPLHIVAAALLTGSPSGPFAAVFGADNTWHRSVLCVFGSTGSLAYAEVLDDDQFVVQPHPDSAGVSLLLGGRGVVWRYRFPVGL